MSLKSFLHRMRKRIFGRRGVPRRSAARLRVVRLEDRNLLDATAAFVAGTLTLDSFTGVPDTLTISDSTFDPGGIDFALTGGNWAAAPTGLTLSATNIVTLAAVDVASLNNLTIDGSGSPLTAVDSANDLQISTLNITDGGAVTMSDASNDFDTVSVTGDSLTLSDADGLELSSVSTTGAVDVTAAGDVQIGSLASTGSTLSVVTTAGSINDAGDNLTTDLSANGLITLTAHDEIGGTPTAGTTTDTAGSLEFAAGSLVDISSTSSGDLVLAGNGALSLTDIDTANGAITVYAAGDLDAVDVASLTDNDANDISLTTTSGAITIGTVNSGSAGDVNLTSATAINDDGSGLTQISADVLTGNAAGAITVDTSANSVNLTTSAAGDIDVDETDAVTLTNITAADGSVTVHA
ncbi:MAG TPA: hypothetical protein DCG12_22130, partial [Planctomycetaceae bacterium]|nr:hypothetical protein [Planctomycetaceae bacterium]